jgi:cell wall-associated NlpC family hydrolase
LAEGPPANGTPKLAQALARLAAAATLALPAATAMLAFPATAEAGKGNGGTGLPPEAAAPANPPAPLPAPTVGSGGAPAAVPLVQGPGAVARLSADGRTAIPPSAAPEAVKGAIYAANRITRRPYVWGGGHGGFRSRGYDCSGSISYALHGGGILDRPLASGDFTRWGEPGPGAWITVYANATHAYAVIAGLRFDTSGQGERGPRWRSGARSSRSFKARHPAGY